MVVLRPPEMRARDSRGRPCAAPMDRTLRVDCVWKEVRRFLDVEWTPKPAKLPRVFRAVLD